MSKSIRAFHESTYRTWHVSAGETPIGTIAELEEYLCGQRGVDAAGRDGFFGPRYADAIHDPHLLFGMQEAVDRIYYAIEHGQHILVYGDYDVDGMSSAAIVIDTLQRLGASAVPYLPHRMDDGYGINGDVIKRLEAEFDLLISVDCGVSNTEEIAWLLSRGKDAIIVDHHEMPDVLPPARAVIHPRHPLGTYPWGHLSGAGVSFKLAQALLRDKRAGRAVKPNTEKWLLDLALLGTVGDVMPLLDENRAIVRFGIEILRMGKRLGLRALADAARVPLGTVTAQEIAFRLIPLLNAAGRVDHPQAALTLLLADSESRARQAAEQLVLFNKTRQALTRRIVREAEAVINPADPVLFAADLRWSAGIVGLVAGQLARKFDRPAVIVGGNGRHGVGSARTAGNINILAGLEAVRDHTLRLGGHAQAAGFSIEERSLEAFGDALRQHYSSSKGTAPKHELSQTADAIVDHCLLSWDSHRLLQQFEPFGEANRQPQFVVKNVPVVSQRLVGKEGQHLKCSLALEEGEIDAIGFGLGEQSQESLSQVDAIGSLEVNAFRGQASLQLRLSDIAPAGSVRIITK